jgi:hypothetical protein
LLGVFERTCGILVIYFWEWFRQHVMLTSSVLCLCQVGDPLFSRDVPECGGATFPWEISNWASSPPVSLFTNWFSCGSI